MGHEFKTSHFFSLKTARVALNHPLCRTKHRRAAIDGAGACWPAEGGKNQEGRHGGLERRGGQRQQGAGHHQEEEPRQRQKGVAEEHQYRGYPSWTEGGKQAEACSDHGRDCRGSRCPRQPNEKRRGDAHRAVAAELVGPCPVLGRRRSHDRIAVLKGIVVARHAKHKRCTKNKEQKNGGSDPFLHAASKVTVRVESIPANPTTHAISKLTATSTGRSRFITADHASWPTPGTVKITSMGTRAPRAVTMDSVVRAHNCGATLGRMCRVTKARGDIPCALPCNRCGERHAPSSKLRRKLNSLAAMRSESTSTGPPASARMQAVAIAAVGIDRRSVNGNRHRTAPCRRALIGNAAQIASSQPRERPCARSKAETCTRAPINCATGT